MSFKDNADKEIANFKIFAVGHSDCPTCLRAYNVEAYEDYTDDDGNPQQGLKTLTANAGDEGSFSWQGCDLCGNPLGGTLYAAHGVSETFELTHYDICQDCMQYVANGEDCYEDEEEEPE